MAAALNTVAATVPASLVYGLLSELGVNRDDVESLHIDHLGVTVKMWARNEWGNRYMTNGAAAKHTICIPIQSNEPL